ncbi:glycosyltransferase family 2 protein [Chitinophaga cymbidii]|uniref:Glycosyl transferase n=1 Tax=Chitinophaga cymbidii TaxID=1096750 RepID=A0A512RGS9_9BACT|nr:glycosyltransferase family 2 protein [Chitinophaga cymbidii]GEP94895.1 glycosyl transferase [Chitinophaga cymbidii]
MLPAYDVAIILLNYNSSSFTVNCVESIWEQTDRSLQWQIIIVDNNSAPEDYQLLQSALQGKPHLTLIRSILNLGFTGGNMLGIQHCNARYIYFLNNDTLLQKNTLNSLHRFMETHPDAGICSGQMLNDKLQPINTFNYFPTISMKILGPGLLRLFRPEDYPKRNATYADPLRVPLVSGASMFVRYSMLADVGGMDPNYFFYCEEEDLAYTFRKKGWHCYLVPQAGFVHFVSTSTTVKMDFLQEYYYSLLYFFSKHHSTAAYICLKWWYFFKLLKKTYKDAGYARIAWMIAKGAPPCYSLRFKQKMQLHQ